MHIIMHGEYQACMGSTKQGATFARTTNQINTRIGPPKNGGKHCVRTAIQS